MHHCASYFFLVDASGNRHKISLIQYIAPAGNSKKIDIKPHGNSKVSNPYIRTCESTLRAMKSESKQFSPKEVVEKVCRDKGGEMFADNAGSQQTTSI